MSDIQFTKASNAITQLHNLTPQQILNPIEELKIQIRDLRENFEPKTPIEFMSRQEVADLLKIDLTTLWKYTKDKKLISYGIGNRVLYKRNEVINAIIQLNR